MVQPRRKAVDLDMARPRSKSPTPAASASKSKNEEAKRHVYIIMSSALVLFLMSTFILVEMLPSPAAFNDSTMVGVASNSNSRNDDKSDKSYSALQRRQNRLRRQPKSEPKTNDVAVDIDNHAQDARSNVIEDESSPESESITNKVEEEEANKEEEHPPRIIHILETRFMQDQPNLIQLAKARLHLMKTICLPTVLHQTAWGQFVWIIRTDPMLDPEIKKDLVSMLHEAGALIKIDKHGKEHALTYVIGSNDNYIVSNSTTISPNVRPFDIHAMLTRALSQPEYLFAGKAESMQLLQNDISSQRISKDVIMWTRLDADDGLNVGFMGYVQNQAVRYFLPDWYDKELLKEIPGDDGKEGDDDEQTLIKNTYSPPRWTYWCAGRNIDWFLTDPIHDPHHKNGTVYPVVHLNVCVTPGVTMALHGSFDPHQVPRLDHDKIISYIRPKGGKLCQRTGYSAFDETDVDREDKDEVDDGSCFHMINQGVASVRSRTPTSAGMMGVNPDATQMKMVRKMPTVTPYMWRSMKKDFRLSNEDLMGTNLYFAEHIYDIAEENARGQCTKGHSCKTSSKDLLQQYVDLRGETRGGFDIIDGEIIAADNRVD